MKVWYYKKLLQKPKTVTLRKHIQALQKALNQNKIPNWLKNYSGTDAEFEAQIKGYIKATVTHFASIKTANSESVVDSWVADNEYFTSNTSTAVFNMRIGLDYVAKCFTWARKSEPSVKLFYNDYSFGSQNSKATKVVDMVENFKANSIPIDGIGMQMHINSQYPDLTTLTDNLGMLKNTGLPNSFLRIRYDRK